MTGGTKVKLSADVKDELIFEGNDNAMVSLMCSQVSQSCNIGTKDERKFLDGVYVSEKCLAQPREWVEYFHIPFVWSEIVKRWTILFLTNSI